MEFIVEGDPQWKARPRFSQKSGTVYTPAKTVRYERLIRKAFLDARGETIPAGCYVAITVDAYFRIPKSYTKGKRLACQHNVNRPAKKPDIDNVLKAVMDALNGVAYEDDKQVVRGNLPEVVFTEYRLFENKRTRSKGLIRARQSVKTPDLFSVFYRWEEKECIIMIMWMQ